MSTCSLHTWLQSLGLAAILCSSGITGMEEPATSRLEVRQAPPILGLPSPYTWDSQCTHGWTLAGRFCSNPESTPAAWYDVCENWRVHRTTKQRVRRSHDRPGQCPRGTVCKKYELDEAVLLRMSPDQRREVTARPHISCVPDPKHDVPVASLRASTSAKVQLSDLVQGATTLSTPPSAVSTTLSLCSPIAAALFAVGNGESTSGTAAGRVQRRRHKLPKLPLSRLTKGVVILGETATTTTTPPATVHVGEKRKDGAGDLRAQAVDLRPLKGRVEEDDDWLRLEPCEASSSGTAEDASAEGPEQPDAPPMYFMFFPDTL